MDSMASSFHSLNQTEDILQKLADDLSHERQLNRLLDAFRNHSMTLINKCQCDVNRDIVDRLNQFSAQYDELKSQRQSTVSDLEIDDTKSADTTETDVLRPQIELRESDDSYVPNELSNNSHHMCHQCPQHFPSALELQIHTFSVHKGVSDDGLQLFTCDECREVVVGEELFEQHRRDIHGFTSNDNNNDSSDDTDEDYMAENQSLKCLKSVEQMAINYKPSVSTKRWTKTKSCATNAVRNYGNDYMRQYLVENVPNYGRIVNKFQCNECHKWMPSETALEIHLNKYHKNLKPFVCVVCGDAFFANLSLLNHLSQKHRISSFECDSCDYKTRTKHHLIQHKISHSMDKPFKCHFIGCGKSFKRKFRLMNHRVLHYNQFTCRECNEEFGDNATLLSHLSHKHKQSVFECTACDYKTRNRHHLIRHEIIHSTDRPFVCRYDGCNLSFKRKDYLLRHEKLH